MATAEQINALPGDLGFAPVGEATLLGEPEGVPTALTLLEGDPLSLLLRFRVNPEGRQKEAIAALIEGAGKDEATLEFDGNFVVFCLYNLGAADNAAIRSVVTHMAGTIASTDFALEPGCQQCGDVESAELLFAADRPARLCAACLSEAVDRHQELEAELNRPTLASTVGLTGAIVYGAIAWGVFWAVIELVLRRLRVRVIEVNEFTVLLAAVLFAAVGYGVGRPIGKTVGRSIAVGRVPWLSSVPVVLGVGVAGEIVLLTLLLLWDAGIFNLGVAANFVWAFVAGYSLFWILCKVALLGFLWFFCAMAATERRTAALET